MRTTTQEVCAALVVVCLASAGGCSLAFDRGRHHGEVDAGPDHDAGPLPDGSVPDAAMMACTDDDADGDGYRECDGDCDDADATRYPDATPQCGDMVQASCNAGDRMRLRDVLGSEVGVFVIRRTLPGLPRDMQFALTPGLDDPRGHPTFAVVGMLGSGPTLDVRTINLAYFEDIADFDEAELLGSTPARIDAFSLAPANDFDSREVFMGLLGDVTGAAGVTTVFGSEFGGPTTTGVQATTTAGVAPHVATSAHSLRSETSSHVLVAGDRVRLVDPRTGMLQGSERTIPGLGMASRLSTSGDGVVLVHTDDPSQLGMVLLPASSGLLGDPAIVGPAAAIARDPMGGASLSFVSDAAGAQVSLGRADCAADSCDVDDASITTLLAVRPGETVAALAGQALNDGGTTPVALAHATLARGAESDRILLSVLTPQRVPIPAHMDGATYIELRGAVPQRGRVRFMSVSAATREYGFSDGGPIITYRIIVVATIVEADGVVQLVLTGLRACGML